MSECPSSLAGNFVFVHPGWCGEWMGLLGCEVGCGEAVPLSQGIDYNHLDLGAWCWQCEWRVEGLLEREGKGESNGLADVLLWEMREKIIRRVALGFWMDRPIICKDRKFSKRPGVRSRVHDWHDIDSSSGDVSWESGQVAGPHPTHTESALLLSVC